jgi:hypothetical protein
VLVPFVVLRLLSWDFSLPPPPHVPLGGVAVVVATAMVCGWLGHWLAQRRAERHAT